MHLPVGLYERLIDRNLASDINQLHNVKLTKQQLDEGDSHDFLAAHLQKVIASVLKCQPTEKKLARQAEIFNKIIDVLVAAGTDINSSLAGNPSALLEVRPKEAVPKARPDTPLSVSCVLTRTKQDPTLESQLKKEIDSADGIDILCSFIKWTGIRHLKDSLAAFTGERSKNLRVITTSYMGVTEVKAVETLKNMTNAQVKLSYDHERTRLHAKAFVFHRKSGFGTAYIGSANISHAALTDGLEWAVKISQYETPHLWEKMIGAFETHWNGKEFELYDDGSREKLESALRSTAIPSSANQVLPNVDLKPYPFQQEILDQIAVERFIHHRSRHLIVAATGTGKTLIAAFDYANFSSELAGPRPNLLFIAHTEEILKQSLAVFRLVLKDYNFGDLFLDGRRPGGEKHVFMSIQTMASINRAELMFDEDWFDYVVIDEFHRAAAESYQVVRNHFKPKCLLGLTATPERADGGDVLGWFDGHISAQIRLPDAINRKLLCPFQYFGITDNVNLESLRWVKGGYVIADLERLYTQTAQTADARVDLICDKLNEILLDPRSARAIGFCVSVRHAEYMAAAFTKRDLKAVAVTGESDGVLRSGIRERLRSGELNYVFTVNLYNEGVDIPEIDTVLFLRPTESLTIFLQQLGRGLRHADKKECLTVLDFIGQANKKYRFDNRYRALLDDPSRPVASQIRDGFPHLPAGCSIDLERKAQEHVLSNINRSINSGIIALTASVSDFHQIKGTVPRLAEFLEYFELDPDSVFKYSCFSRVLARAKLLAPFVEKDEEVLTTGLRRIQHIGSMRQINFLLQFLADGPRLDMSETSPTQVAWLTMMLFSLFGIKRPGSCIADALERLCRNPTLCSELLELLEYRAKHLEVASGPIVLPYDCPMDLHAQYTRDELLAALGDWTFERRPDLREGVKYISKIETDVLLITLNKTQKDYSPTTMYADRAESETLFHWQSQNNTAETTPAGRRYIHHGRTGSTVLLFVRADRSTRGLINPYYFLGPADFVSSSGNKPMNIYWRLRHAMPAKLFRMSATLDTA